MKLETGKELQSNGYKLESFFATEKRGRTYFTYEYSIFMERIDTFKHKNKIALDDFLNKMNAMGYYITEF